MGKGSPYRTNTFPVTPLDAETCGALLSLGGSWAGTPWRGHGGGEPSGGQECGASGEHGGFTCNLLGVILVS